jgi:hypothetical protein
VDWLAAFDRASGGRLRSPQYIAALGVHVGFGICHLCGPQVVDLVAGAVRSGKVAFDSLPVGMAWNGLEWMRNHSWIEARA